MKEPVRFPPLSEFSTREKVVMAFVSKGFTYREIAMRMSIGRQSVRACAAGAAKKIPGELPIMTKIHFWARGATEDQLTGEGWIPGP